MHGILWQPGQNWEVLEQKGSGPSAGAPGHTGRVLGTGATWALPVPRPCPQPYCSRGRQRRVPGAKPRRPSASSCPWLSTGRSTQ